MGAAFAVALLLELTSLASGSPAHAQSKDMRAENERNRALGGDPYGHPYPFAPDTLHAEDLLPWQRSGPSFSIGAGSQYANLGVQLGYQWAPAPGDFALVPYASAGVLTGGDGVHALAAWAAGVMGSYGGSFRWLVGFGYGAWGHVGLNSFGRVIGERALYRGVRATPFKVFVGGEAVPPSPTRARARARARAWGAPMRRVPRCGSHAVGST